MEIKVQSKSWWGRKTGGQKASFIISMVMLFFSILILIGLCFSRQIFGDEVGDLVLGEGIPNGFVAFGASFKNNARSWMSTIVIIVLGFLIAFLLNLVIRLCTFKGKKAKTIGSLCRSAIKYITVIVVVALVLSAWKVNIAGIVASVGVLTLVVGLGCQSLISDVISGFFIVFDDFFDVGDTIIVDGFRGTVLDIGLKSTKVVDYAGNVKVINNSSIATVVNQTRKSSVAPITFSIGYGEDLERVEGIIAEYLPKIKEAVPAILDGPDYKGVSSFGEAGVDLLFVARCNEDDRFQVTRDINRELYLMCRAEGIEVTFRQITVNQPEVPSGKRATAKNKEDSEALNRKNREKPKAAKKKASLLQRTKEAMEDPFNKDI